MQDIRGVQARSGAGVPAGEASGVRLERVGNRPWARHAAVESLQEDRAVWPHERDRVMSGKDWNSELKKIDRMLEGASDEALLPAKNAPTPAARAEAVG